MVYSRSVMAAFINRLLAVRPLKFEFQGLTQRAWVNVISLKSCGSHGFGQQEFSCRIVGKRVDARVVLLVMLFSVEVIVFLVYVRCSSVNPVHGLYNATTCQVMSSLLL